MILSSIVKAGTKVGTQVISHLPEIMIAGGIIGGGVTAVLAGKQTLKAKEYLDSTADERERLSLVEEELETEGVVAFDDDGNEYTMVDLKADRRKLSFKTIGTLALTFSPVVCVGLASGAMVLCGYNIMKVEKAMIAATAVSLDYNFRKYRERVIEAEGEEADFCYKTGATMGKVEREVVDEKTGEIKKKKVKEPVLKEDTIEPLDYSVNYLREASWLSDYQDMSMIMKDILMVEDSANTLLKSRWFLTWNEVRTMLHLKQTTAGQIVGWTTDIKTGDCEVRLRPRIVFDEKLGHDTIILDPNVDGIMANRIDEICEKRKAGIAL